MNARIVIALVSLFIFMQCSHADEKPVRNMTIDEYIEYVNPQFIQRYQDKNGKYIRCVKIEDQISLRNTTITYWRDLNANTSKPRTDRVCPQGTLAIKKIQKAEVERFGSVENFLTINMNRLKTTDLAGNWIKNNPDEVHVYSIMKTPVMSIQVFRVDATVSVWKPRVAGTEFSLCQIWVTYEDEVVGVQSIEAGWHVYPSIYDNDGDPRFFVYWTANNYDSGCYNTECGGFVALGDVDLLGNPLAYSQDGGQLIELRIAMYQAYTSTRDPVWVLEVDGWRIGYWPGSLFPNLGEWANGVEIGGEIAYDTPPPGAPITTTEMGSGQFATAGMNYAAYVKGIGIVASPPGISLDLERQEDRPECWSMSEMLLNEDIGYHFFYGGPGGNDPGCRRDQI